MCCMGFDFCCHDAKSWKGDLNLNEIFTWKKKDY